MSPTKQKAIDNADFQRKSHHGVTVYEPHPDDLGRSTPASQVAPVLDVSSMSLEQPEDVPWKAVNPFGEDALVYEVDVPINTSQLQDEISERVGSQVHLAASSESDEPFSRDNVGTLFVTPGDVERKTVLSALDKHKPDPLYGISDQNRAFMDLRERVGSGKAMTAAELTEGLAVVLGVSPTTEA